MTNEKIAAMAAWTLEDFQEDPLGAVEQVRALASAYQDLQKERDAAVKEMERLASVWKDDVFCRKECQNYSAEDDRTEPCAKWPCDAKWRGPQGPEQVIDEAAAAAGEYADGPVLAQA